MNPNILNKNIQKFINEHLNSDVSRLMLKGTNFENVSTREIIEQIEAKQKCYHKLPTWYNTEGIYYPNKLNIEQTSSEITANYKSKLFNGNTIVDLTGGFGVDSYYFSKRFETVLHIEIDERLSKIVHHNAIQMNRPNIECISGSGIDWVLDNANYFDWIYIDPSRRHDSKGKVFFLKDCIPEIPSRITDLFKKTEHIAIKTSPLLDISAGISELKHVLSIHIVAVKNEVKELIWVLKNGFKGEPTIETVNILADANEAFSFLLRNESELIPEYHKPLNYLYEPNAAILKSGGFNNLSKRFNLYKLHKHSHLYTSDKLIAFTGRRFTIEHIIPFNKKSIRDLKIVKANITIRNFPLSVDQLRKRFSIKDGGNIYLFFTTNFDNEKIVLVCSKI